MEIDLIYVVAPTPDKTNLKFQCGGPRIERRNKTLRPAATHFPVRNAITMTNAFPTAPGEMVDIVNDQIEGGS